MTDKQSCMSNKLETGKKPFACYRIFKIPEMDDDFNINFNAKKN